MTPVSAANATPMVTLKDGTQVQEMVYGTTMLNLKVIAKKPLVLAELFIKCKNPDYQFLGYLEDSEGMLKTYSFIDHRGKVHDTVKNIVLNATQKRGEFVELVDPRLKV